MQVTLFVNKSELMAEVEQTAAYRAAKLPDAEEQYSRVATVESDEDILERFFREAAAEMTQTLKSAVVMQSTIGKNYQVVLELSNSFSDLLVSGMQLTLYGYFKNAMTARWLSLTGQLVAADYFEASARHLTELHRNSLFKRAPRRPSY